MRDPDVKISLTPRTSEFYELFGRAGENALAVAQLVERRFREYPNSDVTQEEIKAAETEGDALTRDLIHLLNTQYLTPFDRDDIYMLATEIDDVVDYLEEASDLLGLYGVELPTRHAVEQCRVLVSACERLAAALENLKGQRGHPADPDRAEGVRGRGRPVPARRTRLALPRRSHRPTRRDSLEGHLRGARAGARRLRDGGQRDREYRRQERVTPNHSAKGREVALFRDLPLSAWRSCERHSRRRRRRRAVLRLHQRVPRYGELDCDERLDPRALAPNRGRGWPRY